ncbi:MAG: CheR family methyltransferase [Ginsengibacter sp.]
MQKNKNDTVKILSKNLFPVVGIGASAGGLDAFKKLITAIPEHSGMAYILVQHLHPGYESALPEILQRQTKIPVVEIEDNVHVDPNRIYVIPSNKTLVATDGVLKLSPRPTKDKQNMPIDIFFSSLAEVHEAHSIGVILSGTGADGTEGLRNIKERGGFTFAQSADSAAYDAMPQHAIDADAVDFILPPEKIPQRLMELQLSFATPSSQDEPGLKNKTSEDEFRQILAVLRVRLGVDFSFYKQTTIRRRIIRRMVILKFENVSDYLDYLKNNKPELELLFHDLLIPVTSFFRDTKTFETLCEDVIPLIVKDKSTINPLRIWVAGCSTGQEAYSIAICLHEYLSDHFSNTKIQIFATDISEQSIKAARNGTYSKKELEGISEYRLNQFFNKIDGHYQVKKTIRDTCIFAVHNLLKDPPFSKMDLISCRNVLIYFEPFLQKKALSMFHYALNDKGTLLLGKSETTGSSSDLFNPFGKKDKLYTKKSMPGRIMNVVGERNETAYPDKNYFLRSKEGKGVDFQRNADEILLSKAPVGVVVNDQFDIVQYRGSTGEYLEASPGKPSLNVLKMAKEGLSFEIRNALYNVKKTKEPFIKEEIPINKGKQLVTIEVIPLLNTIDLHYLILFREHVSGEEQSVFPNPEPSNLKAHSLDLKRIEQLEKELAQAREDMRSITEEQEAANEELQSANEELLSGSEELQSLNEELETSKEELQSTNEELITVNQELYDRNDQLNLSRKFAEATLSTLHESMLVLDKNFVIKSANNSFYKIFQLTEEETLGKILFELQNNSWDIPGLHKELVRIQKEKEKMIEVEITFIFPVIGERTICFNIQPIRRENDEQLILLALDDITLRKNSEQILQKSETKFRELIYGLPAAVYTTDTKGFIKLYNEAAERLWGRKPEIGKDEWCGSGKLFNADGNPLPHDECPMAIALKEGRIVNTEIIVEKPDGSRTNVIPYPQLEYDGAGKITGAINTLMDITEQVKAKNLIQQNADMLNNLFMNTAAFICIFKGPEYIYELVNPEYQKLFGTRKLMGLKLLDAIPEIRGTETMVLIDNVYKTGVTHVGTETLIYLSRDEGREPEASYFNFSYQPMFNLTKEIDGILVFGYEVTEQFLAKKQVEKNMRLLLESISQITITASPDGRITFYNKYYLDYTGLTLEKATAIMGWRNIIHPDDLELTLKNGKHSMATGEDFYDELRLKRKSDGTYRWHLARATAIKDDTGKIISWVGAATDIHDQKMKEQRKDEFIGVASHEMRTPLTTAKAYLQLLELTIPKDNENANLYAKKAIVSVDRLNDLISELLDVSKIQNGKLNYHITTFNFNEMIDNTIEEVKYSSPERIIIKTGEIDQKVVGDKDRLQQVVINLLNNAIKYSPGGGKVLINVALENEELKVSVKDEGIGVSQRNLEKIFERYFRVEDPALPFQGLGIGLFISYEIIQRHHGKIWAESKSGKGSTFYFSIPAGKV